MHPADATRCDRGAELPRGGPGESTPAPRAPDHATRIRQRSARPRWHVFGGHRATTGQPFGSPAAARTAQGDAPFQTQNRPEPATGADSGRSRVPGRIRTSGLLIRSQPLYPLSYGHMRGVPRMTRIRRRHGCTQPGSVNRWRRCRCASLARPRTGLHAVTPGLSSAARGWRGRTPRGGRRSSRTAARRCRGARAGAARSSSRSASGG